MRRTVLLSLALSLAACGDDPTSPDLGPLAGFWEGTSGDSVAVEVVILPPGEGSSVFGCASFRFPWMGEDSRETIDVVGSVEGDAVVLHEAPTFTPWDYQGQRIAQDTLSGTSDPEHHRSVAVTLRRTSLGGICDYRALP
jgi:hypothetical protein